MVDLAIRKAVMAMTREELNELIGYVNVRRDTLNVESIVNLEVGDKVSFNAKGRTITGTVSRFVRGAGGKVDLDKCSDGRRWRISASLAKKVVA